MLQSCTTSLGPKKIANEWCDCMKTSVVNDSSQFKSKCDSIAESQLNVLLRAKMKEVSEKNFPLDSVKEYLHSTHMEYHKLTEDCKKER